ncbi:unnamed protein product, partial [Laminaria digitata]
SPSPSTAPGSVAAAGSKTTATAAAARTTHISETRAKHREMRTFFGSSHPHDDSAPPPEDHVVSSSSSPMTQQGEREDLPSSRSALSGIFELEMESPTPSTV